MGKRTVRAAGLFFALLLGCTMLFPATLFAADAPPDTEAEAYILMDAITGQVIVEKNSMMQAYPASITKILTSGLILENTPGDGSTLGTPVEVSYRACHELIYGASHIALTEGEVVSLNDLLHATQIESANDAANMLAEYNDGSIEAFADRMNGKIAALGLTGTHFVNPSGQPNADHYTTAYDMAQITRWALTIPGFRELFASTEYQMAPTNKRTQGLDYNVGNYMILPGNPYYYEGVTGGKQGYTTDARYTLVTTAQRGDIELICVVLKAETNDIKYTTTRDLLDYGFDNFSKVSYPAANIPAVDVPVFGGGKAQLGEIKVEGASDPTFLLHNSIPIDQVTVTTNVPEKYVVGQPFYPSATMQLNTEYPMQGAALGTIPLTWSGLEGIMAANTTPWSTMVKELPAWVWMLIVGGLVFGVLLFARILYVQNKKNKRRLARMAAARAQIPISIAGRPIPNTRASNRYPAGNTRRSSTALRTNLRVVTNTKKPEQERRVGRVR